MLVRPPLKLDRKTLENLSSYNPRVREAAQAQLTLLGPKAVDALLHSLEDEAVARRRSRMIQILRGIGWVSGMLLTHLILGGLTRYNIDLGDGSDVPRDVYGDYFVPTPFSIAYRNAVLALAGYDDVRALPVLLKLQAVKKSGVQEECEAAIIRLSHLVTATNCAHFTATEYHSVRQGLHHFDSRYACAMLRILGEIGEERDVALIKPLTLLPTTTEGNIAVRQGATDALRHLNNHLENRRLSQILLRPSGLNDPAETLLRPLSKAPAEPEDQLLRARSSNEDNT